METQRTKGAAADLRGSPGGLRSNPADRPALLLVVCAAVAIVTGAAVAVLGAVAAVQSMGPPHLPASLDVLAALWRSRHE